MAKRASAKLKRHSEDIQGFVAALAALLETLEPIRTMVSVSWRPKSGQETEFLRRAGEVDRLTGPPWIMHRCRSASRRASRPHRAFG